MKGKNRMALAIAIALIAGSQTPARAQTAADFQDAEYYKSGGLDLINAAEAYAAGYTGKGVTLGVCDYPINFQHPELLQKANSGMVNFSTYAGGAAGVYPWGGAYDGAWLTCCRDCRGRTGRYGHAGNRL